ncbi:MAG TPA: hypothetical protein VM759_10605 [Longimicrobium sp.]|nr:hypothetical protein [Longimicrobium sp.]
MSDGRYLDERLFPFTEDELRRALALTGDEQFARDTARELAEISSAPHGGWWVGPEMFAALALLSENLRERVDAYMRREWEGMRGAMVDGALWREGLPLGSEPALSVLREADEQIARQVAEWENGCAALADWVRRRQGGEPVGDEPPPWPGQERE